MSACRLRITGRWIVPGGCHRVCGLFNTAEQIKVRKAGTGTEVSDALAEGRGELLLGGGSARQTATTVVGLSTEQVGGGTAQIDATVEVAILSTGGGTRRTTTEPAVWVAGSVGRLGRPGGGGGLGLSSERGIN